MLIAIFQISIASINFFQKYLFQARIDSSESSESSRATVINFGDIALIREKYFDFSRYPSWAHRRNEVLIS